MQDNGGKRLHRHVLCVLRRRNGLYAGSLMALAASPSSSDPFIALTLGLALGIPLFIVLIFVAVCVSVMRRNQQQHRARMLAPISAQPRPVFSPPLLQQQQQQQQQYAPQAPYVRPPGVVYGGPGPGFTGNTPYQPLHATGPTYAPPPQQPLHLSGSSYAPPQPQPQPQHHDQQQPYRPQPSAPPAPPAPSAPAAGGNFFYSPPPPPNKFDQ
ncbi:MAG: hypothetical protein ACK41Y_16330 [Paracoccus hibiscisoli]|uniref:hypothetical protein n=1 Tax=Paracoccus hibiscisoli TaxID=2023261 RepID=UPI00391C8D37